MNIRLAFSILDKSIFRQVYIYDGIRTVLPLDDTEREQAADALAFLRDLVENPPEEKP